MNHIDSQTDSASELREVLGRLVAELRWDGDDMLRLIKREELSMPRIAALHFVAKRGAASISEVSGCLELSLANTSMLVDKLVCRGFVTRVEDANDRRQKIVRLTEKGSALIAELQAMRVNAMVQRMLQLSPDIVERVVDTLTEALAQLPTVAAESPAN
jgi:DNA-binding MarR family transcriptional regulator